MRRQKLNKKNLDISQLFGRSLSDYDLLAMRDILTKEARETLKLGKKVVNSFGAEYEDLVAIKTLVWYWECAMAT
ncbi:hypothetical protein V6N11_018187 [Hibiscus sabdariffa]|uniref:Uncharacterized protein n=1 Tax=Hibiscus sabdariffa TaxID=183260 RepID=A0ABR2T6M0_9ROSI